MRVPPLARGRGVGRIIAALILLVATVGGSLKDEFEIPGSDTQKATDLIESEFASEQGGVLNLVFAAPPGQRLDTPARKAAILAAVAKLKTQQFKPTKDKAGIESVGNPFDKNTFSDDGRIAYAEAQFDRVIYDKDREAVVDVEDAVRDGGGAGRRDRRVQRRRRVPADRAGHAGAARPARGADRAARRLPHLHRGRDPDRAGDHRRRVCVPAAIRARGSDGHQHDHPAARVDDRPRRRDRLLTVHRHPLPTVPARRACSRGRGGGGRRHGGPGRALRRPDCRDLGDWAGVLRARLRDQARHRVRARRPDDGADRQLAPDRGAGEAGPQDRPTEGAVPEAAPGFGGGASAHADRTLGPVRDGPPQAGLPRAALGRPRARRLRPRSSAWAPPTRARSRRSRRPAARTTCSPRASGRASTARSRSWSTSTAIGRLPSASTIASRTSTASRPSASRSSTTRRPSPSSSSRPSRRLRTRARSSSCTGCATKWCPRRRKAATRSPTSPA